MIKKVNRNKARLKRHFRIRNKISGTTLKPRLSVFRSNKAIYVQLIDDSTHNTIISSSSKELNINNNNVETCTKVGQALAKKALAKNINEIVFDRSGYLYHGKIKALAEAARVEGLKF